MPIETMVLGAGKCGLNVMSTELSASTWWVDEATESLRTFLGVDFNEADESLRERIRAAGDREIEADFQLLGAGAGVEGGVGGLWTKSMRVVEERLEAIVKSLRVNQTGVLGRINWLFTVNSGGGGTGVGAGPVLTRGLAGEMLRGSAVNQLVSPIIVLPFAGEEAWRSVNALSSIELYRNLRVNGGGVVDLIFLVDNEWVRRGGYLHGARSEEAKSLVNEATAMAVRSLLLPSLKPEVSTKDFELADIRRALVRAKPSIVAPGHVEFDVRMLESLTMISALEVVLRSGMLIQVDPSYPPDSALVIVKLPQHVAEAYRGGDGGRVPRGLTDHLEVSGWLRERLKMGPEEDVTVVYTGSSKLGGSFSISVFLVNPVIPRLGECMRTMDRYLEDETAFREAYSSAIPPGFQGDPGEVLDEMRSLMGDFRESLRTLSVIPRGAMDSGGDSSPDYETDRKTLRLATSFIVDEHLLRDRLSSTVVTGLSWSVPVRLEGKKRSNTLRVEIHRGMTPRDVLEWVRSKLRRELEKRGGLTEEYERVLEEGLRLRSIVAAGRGRIDLSNASYLDAPITYPLIPLEIIIEVRS